MDMCNKLCEDLI